jgi:hypothetical protein
LNLTFLRATFASVANQQKRGRPALPEGTGKTVMIRVKATPAEVALIDGVAARYDVGRSEVIRRAIHLVGAHPDLIKPPTISAEAYARIMRQAVESGVLRGVDTRAMRPPRRREDFKHPAK